MGSLDMQVPVGQPQRPQMHSSSPGSKETALPAHVQREALKKKKKKKRTANQTSWFQFLLPKDGMDCVLSWWPSDLSLQSYTCWERRGEH